MSQAPMMPLFTDALIGDVQDLSTEEFGAYMFLLIATWRNNGVPFPDNEVRLARICRVPLQRWRTKIRPCLVRFFRLEDGTWRQKKLEKVWQKCANLRAKNSEAGKASALAKSLKKHNTDPTGVDATLEPSGNLHNHNHKEESPSLRSESEKEKNPKREKGTADPPPPPPDQGVLDLEFEAFWREVPRKTGKGQAQRAYKTARKKAAAETLLAGIKAYARMRQGEDPQFTRHASTWLNGQGWLDEMPPPEPKRRWAPDPLSPWAH